MVAESVSCRRSARDGDRVSASGEGAYAPPKKLTLAPWVLPRWGRGTLALAAEPPTQSFISHHLAISPTRR